MGTIINKLIFGVVFIFLSLKGLDGLIIELKLLISSPEEYSELEGKEDAIEWYWNLLMFLGGTVFGFTILKSFFRKASSLEEYWKKITEKNEN